MEHHQQDVLLIYNKRKDNIPLSPQEEKAWAQYRDRYPLPDEASFDEKMLLQFARLQRHLLTWEQYKLKHNIQFPIAFPYDEKQPATAQVIRLRPSYRFGLAVAASLLLVLGAIWYYRSGQGTGEGTASSTATRQQQESLQVPKGSQRWLQLADGTKVWLNAASSFQYPASFGEGERIVKLEEGEAWFEVTKQPASKPFIIEVKGKRIQVLGTSFNVNAYGANPVTTTLLEGKITVTDGKQKKSLIPGQQAVMDDKGITVTAGVNWQDVEAWKNGFFSFHDTRLSIIMESLARWYDVEVVYLDPLSDVPFTIDEHARTAPLEDLLEDLEASQLVKFRKEGKKIIVSK